MSAAERLTDEQSDRAAEIDRQRALREAAAHATTRAKPGTFIDCRVFGHAWEPTEADRNPAFGWYIKARCTRCSTERFVTVNTYGGVQSRRYKYLDSYKDTDHWSRSDWRMQFLRKLQ